MKRPLSKLEKWFIFLPMLALIPLLRLASEQHFFYRLFPHSVLQNSNLSAYSGQFSPNSQLVIGTARGIQRPMLSAWEARTGYRLWHLQFDRDPSWPSFSPDSQLLVHVRRGTITPSFEYQYTPHATVQIFDVKSGRIFRTFNKKWIERAVFVDGGRKLWCDGTPSLLLDAVSGRTLATTVSRADGFSRYPWTGARSGVLMHTTKIHGVEYNQTEIWDFSVGRRVFKFPVAPWKGYREYAVSKDNRTIFVWGYALAKTAEAWDVSTGKKLLSMPERRMCNVGFSPDNQSILFEEIISPRGSKVASYKAGVLNLRTKNLAWQVTFDNKHLALHRFLPDGERIVADRGSSINFLDAHSGTILPDISGITGSEPVPSPDGKHMVVERDNQLQILRIPE
jgi:hypothetical protein